jgi:hypothetical protein
MRDEFKKKESERRSCMEPLLLRAVRYSFSDSAAIYFDSL